MKGKKEEVTGVYIYSVYQKNNLEPLKHFALFILRERLFFLNVVSNVTIGPKKI